MGEFFFKSGVVRLSDSFGDNLPDVTFAFCGDQEGSYLCFPDKINLLLEALRETVIEIRYLYENPNKNDLLFQCWLDLHLIMYPVGVEACLIALTQFLVANFRIKKKDAYLLLFYLVHFRIGELIGTTRSTVTRQISTLCQQHDLQMTEPKGSFILYNMLMRQSALDYLL